MLHCWAGRPRCLKAGGRPLSTSLQAREEVAWAPLGEGLPPGEGLLSTLLPTHSTPQLQGAIRASSTPTVPRLCPRAWSPPWVSWPSIWFSWETPRCVSSTSNFMCPTQISCLTHVLAHSPHLCGSLAIHWFLNPNEGHHWTPCPIRVAC